jgi:hypothetical protein
MTINCVECTLRRIGIPTDDAKSGERFSEPLGMYTSDSDCRSLPLISTCPHLGFQVIDSIGPPQAAMLCWVPYEPIPGVN